MRSLHAIFTKEIRQLHHLLGDTQRKTIAQHRTLYNSFTCTVDRSLVTRSAVRRS
jgi:hypothetical protein